MKTIAITLGDVAGIGPEVVRKALCSGRLPPRYQYHVLLAENAPKVPPAEPSWKAAQFALDSLEEGLSGCLRGNYAALVTAPVHKASLRKLGFQFPGQTEWFADHTRSPRHAMMLMGGGLRVTLVTTHIPLKQVASRLTRERIREKIALTHEMLKKLGIRQPNILVAGLNPHGGVPAEQGHEESEIIVPAVRWARKKYGPGIEGPFSPDLLFWLARKKKADAVICMYHDQGLIPLKMLAFDEGVNATLGLPIIRTSPDHGTAYEIAGKNKASPNSMIEAIRWACKLTEKKVVW